MTDNWQDANYEDAINYEAVQGDLEYEVIISDVTPDEEKRNVRVNCEIANHEFAKRISLFVNYSPFSRDGAEPDAAAINSMKLSQKRFFEGFGIPKGEDNFMSCELWKGKRATVILSKQPNKNPDFGDENKIKQYVKPVSESFG